MNKEALITKTAQESLAIEIATLEDLKASINDDFVQSVLLINQSVGRVIVTGIGKSAIVAQKIVATLNSTGTPSIFLHAADAIHGDLGMIKPDDIVICLSKSGETPEIKVLAPLLKTLGNTLIAMVSNDKSYLATQAAYILHTPVKKEADPNNLAPTASTTAQIVMGDALATSLLALKGFSPQDFAQFHPGGALGKQLYLRVQDLFPQNEAPKVGPEDSLRATILEMTSKRLGMTAVTDANNRILGIVTDGDLRRMLEKDRSTEGVKAKDLMTTKPLSILPQEMAVKALSSMRQKSITQLIVADEQDQYLGVIHLHDLIREGLI